MEEHQVTPKKPYVGEFRKQYRTVGNDYYSRGDQITEIELADGTKLDTDELSSSEVAPGVHFEENGRNSVVQTIKITHEAELPIVLHLDPLDDEYQSDDLPCESMQTRRDDTKIIVKRKLND